MARGLKAVVSNKMPRWKLLKGHGALCSWAELIDLEGVETLLEETLDEEKATDLLLTQLAEEAINIKSA
jgi:ferritin-like metal-binding protein YciE